MAMAKLDATASLQRCASELGHPPARSEYVRWRQRLDHPRQVLSDQRIALGRGWVEALTDAGLERRSAVFTTAQVWIQIEHARRALGAPSVDEYQRWRARTTPRPIAAPTILARTGRKWSELFPPV